MSDINDLMSRIEEARRRLGAADQAQIKQIEDLNERIKAVKAGLSTRYRELEAHREEVSTLRRENEQLRQMMHRLLLAVEDRPGSRLKSVLQDFEKQVSVLLSLAGNPVAAAGPARAPATPGRADAAKAAPVNGAAAAADPPSEKDSRWLHEIMERARELTDERARANTVAAASPPSRSAVA